MINIQEKEALADSILRYPKDKRWWALERARNALHFCDESYFDLVKILDDQMKKVKVDK